MIRLNPKYADATFTPQFIFDELKRGVEEGVLPGYNTDVPYFGPKCQYETPDGHKCAFGLFIEGADNSCGTARNILSDPENASLKERLCGAGVTESEWSTIQNIHDSLRGHGWDGPGFLDSLEDFLGLKPALVG